MIFAFVGSEVPVLPPLWLRKSSESDRAGLKSCRGRGVLGVGAGRGALKPEFGSRILQIFSVRKIWTKLKFPD